LRVVRVAVEQHTEVFAVGGVIVGVGVAHRVLVDHELLDAGAEHVGERPVEPHQPTVRRGQRHSERRVIEREREQLLGVTQGMLDPRAFGHVLHGADITPPASRRPSPRSDRRSPPPATIRYSSSKDSPAPNACA